MTQPAADILDTLAHVLTTAATALRQPPTEVEPTEPTPADASIATPNIPAGDATPGTPTPDFPAGDITPAAAPDPIAAGASTLDALAGRLTDPNIQ